MLGKVIQSHYNCINKTNTDRAIYELAPSINNSPVPNGPCVNVIDRAFYLLQALDNFAQSSEKSGYYTITKQNEKGNSSKINNLFKRSGDYLHEGRVAFLRANSLDPYADNSIKKQQLIAKIVIMSDDFKDTYTGPGTKDRRDQLRRQLFKQIELLNTLELGI